MFGSIGQERDVSCSLDRLGQHPLMFGARPRLATRPNARAPGEVLP